MGGIALPIARTISFHGGLAGFTISKYNFVDSRTQITNQECVTTFFNFRQFTKDIFSFISDEIFLEFTRFFFHLNEFKNKKAGLHERCPVDYFLWKYSRNEMQKNVEVSYLRP